MRLVGKSYRYAVLVIPWFAAIAGFMAGLQPAGVEWRWFSFHPLLMTMGFVGMMVRFRPFCDNWVIHLIFIFIPRRMVLW